MSRISQIKEAFEIFEKYNDKFNEDYPYAEHDEIMWPCDVKPEDMDGEDAEKLDKLGFRFESTYECWMCFV